MGTLTVDNTRWGVWRLEKSNSTLCHARRSSFYVELDTITTTGQMLDSIFEVSQKSWVTREDVGNLVDALDALFDPRQNFCPGGASRAINATELLRQRVK
jgi:hypothetical protein